MGDRVWQIPRERFVAAWNGAASLAEAVERVKELAGGNVPRWAVMARALALRKDGIVLKKLRVAALGSTRCPPEYASRRLTDTRRRLSRRPVGSIVQPRDIALSS